MTEIRQEVKSYYIDMECDACCSGTMEFVYTQTPTVYLKEPNLDLSSIQIENYHRCSSCGAERSYSCVYPRLVYERIDKPEYA